MFVPSASIGDLAESLEEKCRRAYERRAAEAKETTIVARGTATSLAGHEAALAEELEPRAPRE